MNYLKLFIYLGIIAIALVNCKNDSKLQEVSANNGQNTVGDTSQKVFDPMMIETPSHYYAPTGLRKLNIMEMFNIGNTNPNMRESFPVKDSAGRLVNWDYIDKTTTPMFMQMYANEEGTIVEAVAFPLTDEVKAAIMKVRMVSK